MEGNFAIQGKLYISFSLVSFFRVYCIISMWPYITAQLQKESFSVSGSDWKCPGINTFCHLPAMSGTCHSETEPTTVVTNADAES